MLNRRALWAVVFSNIALQACGVGKIYREINPEVVDLELNKYNDYVLKCELMFPWNR